MSLLYLGFMYMYHRLLIPQLRWYHPVQLLLTLLVSLQSFIPSLLFFHLLIIADGTSVVGAVLGGVAAAAVLLCCISAIPIIYVWRRQKDIRSGIVHTHTCMYVYI